MHLFENDICHCLVVWVGNVAVLDAQNDNAMSLVNAMLRISHIGNQDMVDESRVLLIDRLRRAHRESILNRVHCQTAACVESTPFGTVPL